MRHHLSPRTPLRLTAVALASLTGASCTPLAAAPPATVPSPSALDLREWTDAVVQRAHEAQARGDASAATALFDRALTAWESFAGERVRYEITAASRVDTVSSRGSEVAAVSPDGRWVVLASRGGTLYDTATWSIVARFSLSGNSHTTFDATSRYLFGLAYEKACRIEVATAKQTCVPAGGRPSMWLAASPARTAVAFPCGPELCVWNTVAPAPTHLRWPRSCPAPQRWIDDSTVEGTAPDSKPCYVDVRTGLRVTPSGRKTAAPPTIVAPGEGVVSSDGRRIVWAHDRAIDILGAATRRRLQRLPIDCFVGPPVVLPDRRLWIGCYDKLDFVVIDPHDPERRVAVDPPDASRIPAFGLSQDGLRFATVVGSQLSIWSLRDGGRSVATTLPFWVEPWTPLLFGPGDLLAISRSIHALVVDSVTGEVVFRRDGGSSLRSNLMALGFAAGEGQPALLVAVTKLYPQRPQPREPTPGTIEFLDARSGRPVHPPLTLPRLASVILPALGTTLFLQPQSLAPLEKLELPGGQTRTPVAAPSHASFPTADGRYLAWLGPSGPLVANTVTGAVLSPKLPVKVHRIVGWTDFTLVLMSYDAEPGISRLVLVDVANGAVTVDSPMHALCRRSTVSANGAVFAGYDESSRFALVLKQIGKAGVLGIHLESDGVSYAATDEKGGISTFGPRGGEMVECRVGPWVLPFDICEHRFPRVGFFAASGSAAGPPSAR